MTYEEKKKLIDAKVLIKENCKELMKVGCKGCISHIELIDECDLFKKNPADWHIPKLCRWTPEDVALAKALKAFGAIFLEKERSGAITVHFNNGDLCEAPVLAFKCMPDGSYHIDNIIKEAEG